MHVCPIPSRCKVQTCEIKTRLRTTTEIRLPEKRSETKIEEAIDHKAHKSTQVNSVEVVHVAVNKRETHRRLASARRRFCLKNKSFQNRR